MPILDRARIVLGLVVIGLPVFIVGCDGGATEGTSSVTPETPPPGRSAQDQASARAGAYPSNAAAAKRAAPKPEAAKPEAASKAN
jgi:hypothetical protein